ncbi:MAG: DUF177 domain-containing protein [Clostridia bacterium]
MKFYIAKIVKQNGASIDIKGTEPIEGLQNLEDFTNGYTFSKDVSVDGVLTNIGGRINMNVVAQADWHVECARCLKPVEGKIKVTVNENFQQVKSAEEEPEAESYSYEGDWLVVDRAIADEILSSLPIAQLCQDDCAGLCSECGLNLNETKCTCAERKINPAMEKLKNFNIE